MPSVTTMAQIKKRIKLKVASGQRPVRATLVYHVSAPCSLADDSRPEDLLRMVDVYPSPNGTILLTVIVNRSDGGTLIPCVAEYLRQNLLEVGSDFSILI